MTFYDFCWIFAINTVDKLLFACWFITNFSILHSTFSGNCKGKWQFSFLNDVFLPSWIFKFLIFFLAHRVQKASVHWRSKFHQHQLNGFFRYHDFWFSEWQPSAILDFYNLKILLTYGVQRAEIHYRAKFRQNWSIICWDIAPFQILEILKFYWLLGSGVNLLWRYCAVSIFQDCGRPPAWISLWHTWITH